MEGGRGDRIEEGRQGDREREGGGQGEGGGGGTGVGEAIILTPFLLDCGWVLCEED